MFVAVIQIPFCGFFTPCKQMPVLHNVRMTVLRGRTDTNRVTGENNFSDGNIQLPLNNLPGSFFLALPGLVLLDGFWFSDHINFTVTLGSDFDFSGASIPASSQAFAHATVTEECLATISGGT